MNLKLFELDFWLTSYESTIDFNLAASTGPTWALDDVLAMGGDDARQRFYAQKLTYGSPAGSAGLRAAIGEMQNVDADCIQIVTGASEALVVLFWLAAQAGANVILPEIGFPTFSALPESLGLETRRYRVRRDNQWRLDVEEIEALIDKNTSFVLINSPHNPTGATTREADLQRLHDVISRHGVQLVVDEVYHPIYHGKARDSAAALPNVTVISDFSKAFPLAGVRTGWMLERDAKSRGEFCNARAYFSVSNTSTGELLAEIAVSNRKTILKKSQDVATRNLSLLDSFMREHPQHLAWIRPEGGMTAFPWMSDHSDARTFCVAAAEAGVLLAPGDCFGVPEHFRLGFGACEDGFETALDRLSALMADRSLLPN